MKLNYDRKLNYLLVILITVVILLFNSTALTQTAKTSGNEVQGNQPKTYYFGLLKTSAPISYFDDQAVSEKGYCSALIKTLEKRFSLNIVIVQMVRDEDRFKGKGSNNIKKLDAECGPNTITQKRRETIRKNLHGEFSEPFGWTGATALLLKKDMQKLSPGNEFKTLKIGLPYATTTRDIVKTAYPSLEDKKIVLLENTEDGINRLTRGEVNAYFADEMILTGFLKKLNEQAGAEKYSIKPGLISNEEYGVVVYHADEAKNKWLLEAINLLLREAEIKPFGSTKLKILNNPDFQYFIKNDLNYNSDKVAPAPNSSIVTPKPSPNQNPPSSPDPWRKIVFILALLITLVGVFLLLKSYQNLNNNKLEREDKRRENYYPLTSKNLDDKVGTSSPNINVYLHNANNQSKTRRGNMSNTNNFDQNNSNITVGNQGTNTNTNTQQFVQYTSEQKQDLSQFAKDIQRILEKVEKNQPNATEVEKQKIVSYEISPEQRSRIVRALKAGGEKALEELLDNPYLNVAIAVVKEWQKEE
ncbi:MAG: transporter substrate-binding domain-containing protein [Nostoc sp. NOS(2021)]|uniref:transporter substrate-binding domain-containing protein n=1 Tax=Nostoc sp. NOS(2021) TaxID=2815407 RepID=UPI0025E8DBA1|nr:transporter substrate-binding domain-containing protein [Nostoc sp. NOS(2021)]MBN3899841.1 transporter substrate-binding domain-containing protein [Nostoc sp. NOS(2021)]